MATLIVEGAKEAAEVFDHVSKVAKQEINKMLKSSGNKLRTEVRKTAQQTINTETGHYLNSVTPQNPYLYHKENGTDTNDSVKVYGKKGRITIKAGSVGFGSLFSGNVELYRGMSKSDSFRVTSARLFSNVSKSGNFRVTNKVRYLEDTTFGGAPHTHLIEKGHRKIVPAFHGSRLENAAKKLGWTLYNPKYGKKGKVPSAYDLYDLGTDTREFKVYDKSGNSYDPKFLLDCERLADKICSLV